jgi:hypothetical protein
LYAAKAQLDDEQAANLVKDLLGSKNLMSSAKDALQLVGDMDALVRLNACDGAGLRRFQENVVLFSKGKQPILLPAKFIDGLLEAFRKGKLVFSGSIAQLAHLKRFAAFCPFTFQAAVPNAVASFALGLPWFFSLLSSHS